MVDVTFDSKRHVRWRKTALVLSKKAVRNSVDARRPNERIYERRIVEANEMKRQSPSV